MLKQRFILCAAFLLMWTWMAAPSLFAQEWKSGVQWPEPSVVTPGNTNSEPPSDAIVLFDGTSLSHIRIHHAL